MKHKVFFTDLRTTIHNNMSQKIKLLLDKAGVTSVIKKNDIVAVKLHFGEKGNTAFIRPIFIRDIVDRIYSCGGKPFLTDTNTLYRGERSDAVSHLTVSLLHGFNYTAISAPVIIADGLRGNDGGNVKISGRHFSDVLIASAVVQADVLVSVAHFKGHELSGFGGTLKNLGMGCATREGKMKQHTDISPAIESKNCRACGRCAAWCPEQAIKIHKMKAKIDKKKCIGCAACITVCQQDAIKIVWDENSHAFQEKMAEYALGAVKNKKNKALYLNFLTNISPACDCYGHADRPFVPDIGILASQDPVAIDQASVDLVNAEQGFFDTALKMNHERQKDKFKGLYPEVDGEIQLAYAQSLGMGTRNYKLLRV